jgi:AAA domain
VNHVSGDAQVAEAARIMRLPGSHNTRVPGEELPVVFDALEMSRAYELDELVDFFLEAPPILPPKKTNGSEHGTGGFDNIDKSGPVDSDGELDLIQDAASANVIQCRVIPSLIWKAWHPDEIVSFVVGGTMRAAEQAGLGWDRATEVKHVVARILSAYHNMFEQEYDASTGVIPVWLPGEFHEGWSAALVRGRRPSISRNGGGWHIRSYSINSNGEQFKTVHNAPGIAPEEPGTDNEQGHKQGERERKKPRAALSVKEWLGRALPEPAFCLGWWLTTTTRALIYAPTGLGKSLLAVAIAFATSEGKSFLHWRGHRKMRVLYIDGEMAARLLKRRIMEEATRSNSEPEGLYAINTGDIEDFKPLDDPRGRATIDDEIAAMGGVDLVIFDNIMALLGGDMKDEESWRKTLDWQKSLTRRHIGQIWIHHTGHDESKGYGTKTREWQMDTVIALEKAERPETDVSFILTFKKARERTPETRDDFRDIRVTLINNRWEYEAADDGRGRPSPMGEQFKRALINVLAGDETVLWKGHKAARLEAWRRECVTLGLLDPSHRADSARSLLSKYRRELIQCRIVGCHDDLTWLI